MTISIEDRLALQDLLAAYAWSLDTGDMQGVINCFTEDARLVEEVFEEPDIWVGHEGIRGLTQHYFNAVGFPGRQHHISQLQFFPRSDTSVALRSFAFVTECAGEPPYTLRFTGWYEDEAVKGNDGCWRLSQRTIRLWDGAILKNFPGRGQWAPRQRPESLKRR